VFAYRGRLLFLSDDSLLLGAVLNRSATPPPAGALTYAAGFRHSRERLNYERVMTALDFTSPVPSDNGAPAFFSGNIASLSRALSNVIEIRVTEEERNDATRQTVVYQMTN